MRLEAGAQSSTSLPEYRPAERPSFLSERRRNRFHSQPPADDPDEIFSAHPAEQKPQQITASEAIILQKTAQRKRAEDRQARFQSMTDASNARWEQRLAKSKAAAEITLDGMAPIEQRPAAPQGDERESTTKLTTHLSRFKRRIKLKPKVASLVPKVAVVDAHDLDEATRHHEDIQALLDMGLGWSRAQVEEALEASQWSRNRAADLLLMGVSLHALPMTCHNLQWP
jgi:hypothetical protein